MYGLQMMDERMVLFGLVVLVLMLGGCGGGRATAEPVHLPPTPAPATASPSPASPTPAATVTPRPATEPEATATGSGEPAAELAQPPASTPGQEDNLVPEPTQTPTGEPVVLLPIGQLQADMAGEEVTVEGVVIGAASLSGGFTFTVDDGTGQVVLLMWHDVYDDCWDALQINIGARVRATGKVGLYEGVLQVQPSWGGAVKALEPAAAWAEEREIGSLTAADEGQQVMIQGQVLRSEGHANSVNVFVGDDSGEVAVFLWRSVLDRVVDNVGLGTAGSHVRVVGAVQIYRDNLELKPTLPCDVTVLAIP